MNLLAIGHEEESWITAVVQLGPPVRLATRVEAFRSCSLNLLSRMMVMALKGHQGLSSGGPLAPVHRSGPMNSTGVLNTSSIAVQYVALCAVPGVWCPQLSMGCASMSVDPNQYGGLKGERSGPVLLFSPGRACRVGSWERELPLCDPGPAGLPVSRLTADRYLLLLPHEVIVLP